MYNSKTDQEIITRVMTLSKDQRNHVLEYLDNIPKMRHSTKNYRRKALKQIREALRNPF